MPIATVNPANGELIRSYPALGEEETERRIAAAAETFRQYRTTPFEQRADWLNRAADLLDEDRDTIARTMTVEMGKPVTAARAEAAKCAKAMRWYAPTVPRGCSPTNTRTPTTCGTPAPPVRWSATVRSAWSSP